jgi:hypothetical protein
MIYRLPDGSLKQGSLFRCQKCEFAFTDPGQFRGDHERPAS